VARAERCGARGEELASLLVIAAESHRWLGRTSDCFDTALRARELAAPHSRTHYQALRLEAYAASFAGNLEPLGRLADELATARPSDDALRDWVAATATIANVFVTIGQLHQNERLVSMLERLPLEHFEGDVDLQDLLRRCIGMRAYALGDFRRMGELLRTSARVRLELGDVREHIVQLSNVGFAMMWLGELEASLAAYEEARARAESMKLATLEVNGLQNASFLRYCMGAYDEAIRGSREALAKAQIEAPRSMSLAHATIARALLGLGRAAEAEADAREAATAAPTPVVKMYATAVLADVLLALGRIDDARRESDDGFARLQTIASHAVGDLLTLVVRAEVLEAAGDREGAREAIALAKKTFDARRAYLGDDAARAVYDAHAPESKRLLRVFERLA